MDRRQLHAQIPHALAEVSLPGLPPPRRGKVRDIFPLAGKGALLFVTTDRISAFDRVLGTVPFKGELLTGLAASWFARTADVCRNHVLDRPDPAALVVRELVPVPVEVVVRGFLTGSLWRDYVAGTHGVYGVELPPGLAQDGAFETPIITPTTKEAVGSHDMPISEAQLVSKGLVTAKTWAEIAEKARALFAAGQGWARSRGLDLVDTKYEFGLDAQGGVWLMDEIHTPDSSRYWRRTADGHEALDKEFLRQWLIAQGWKGDGPPPVIPDEVFVDLAARYVTLATTLEGAEPVLHAGPSEARLLANLRQHKLIP
jgi:phosphoribosylaminoimidazole-succinocarboxamide synthase